MRPWKRIDRWLPVVAVVLVWGFLAGDVSAQGSIVVAEEFPVKDARVRILVSNDGIPVGGASVEVTYRPGSSVPRVEPIGVSGQDGGLNWVPSEAGIATITATWTGADQSETAATVPVSVRYDSPPLGGIVIMIVAGLLLVVGSVIRMFNVIRTPQAP